MTAGPYARGRIIDLSKRAAELLDVVQTGTARVRVTYLGRADLNGAAAAVRNPARNRQRAAGRARRQGGHRRAEHRAGRRGGAAARKRRMPMPAAPIPPQMFADNQPTGQVTRVPVPAATHLYVQVGAFSKLDNAKALAGKVGGDLRISTLQRSGQTLYRVRTGAAGFGRGRRRRACPASPARAPTMPISSSINNRSGDPHASPHPFPACPVSARLRRRAGAGRHRHQRRACPADGCARPGRCCGRRTA